jgi:triosephosphate isomerase
MKSRYLFGNWKMYLDYQESVDLAKKIAAASSAAPQDTKIAVFPSAVAFHRVAEVLSSTTIAVGAQNTCWVEKGAYTGEVSAHTYRELGATYTLIGHSERRHIFHETNHEVRQKLESALSVGLTPVVCVGETLQERREGKVDETIEAQLRSAMSELVVPANSSIIVAYEPVWAINTGEACDPAEAERVHALIKRLVAGLTDGLCIRSSTKTA